MASCRRHWLRLAWAGGNSAEMGERKGIPFWRRRLSARAVDAEEMDTIISMRELKPAFWLLAVAQDVPVRPQAFSG